MEALIVRYGLLAVFVGAALEGDVTLILTGVTVHLGLLHVASALSVGSVGAFLADSVCYAVGRSRAATIRSTRAYSRVAHVIEPLAERLGSKEIIVARFVYGARIASMLLWGMRQTPFGRFALLDLIGCVLWATVLGSLGFMFSGSAEMLVGRVRRLEIWLLVAFVAAAAALVVLRGALRSWVRARRPPE